MQTIISPTEIPDCTATTHCREAVIPMILEELLERKSGDARSLRLASIEGQIPEPKPINNAIKNAKLTLGKLSAIWSG
jgi:hypothetical protein